MSVTFFIKRLQTLFLFFHVFTFFNVIFLFWSERLLHLWCIARGRNRPVWKCWRIWQDDNCRVKPGCCHKSVCLSVCLSVCDGVSVREALRDLLSEWTSLNTWFINELLTWYQRDILFACVIKKLLLLFYLFMFIIFYCTAITTLSRMLLWCL